MTEEIEQKEEKEEKPEDTTKDTSEGDKSKTAPTLEEVNAAAERMEAANKERRELVERDERLVAERKLGGMSEAGREAEKPKEETPKEYKDRLMKGELKPSEK